MVFDDRSDLYQGRCEVIALDVAYRISRWCPVDSEYQYRGLTKMREVENPHALSMRCLREGTVGQNQSQGLCDFLTDIQKEADPGFLKLRASQALRRGWEPGFSAHVSPAHSRFLFLARFSGG